MKYAMILKSRVIDLKESETPPKYPPDAYGNDVTAVECSDNVTIGMIYDEETGIFSEPPEPEPPQPTQLDRIEELAKAKNADIAQSAIDNYTMELIEGGLL